MTPPGSACSIGFSTGLPVYAAPPRSAPGLHMVVEGTERAWADLIDRGVDVGDVTDVGGGFQYASPRTRTATA